MRPKRPVLRRRQEEYPTLKESKVDRRKFLAMLGGGVASSALISACYDSDEMEKIDQDDSHETDTEDPKSTEHVEIDTNEPLAGGEVAPEYYERRLPATGFDSLVVLSDNTTVVYAIATRFEEWSFQEIPELDLLSAVRQKLSTSFRGHEFGQDDKLPLIEKMSQEILEAEFKKSKGLDPGFIDVSFVVERIDYNEEIAGDVADPDWPTDSA